MARQTSLLRAARIRCTFRLHTHSSLRTHSIAHFSCTYARAIQLSSRTAHQLQTKRYLGYTDEILTLFEGAPRGHADASDLDSASLALGNGAKDCTLRVSVVCRFHTLRLVVCKAVLPEGETIACCVPDHPLTVMIAKVK